MTKLEEKTQKDLLPLLEKYVAGELNKKQFISSLQNFEGSPWYFVLDLDRILFRTKDSKLVISFNLNEETVTKRKSSIRLQKFNVDMDNVDFKNIEDKKEEINKTIGNKKIIAFSGAARTQFNKIPIQKYIINTLKDLSPSNHAILSGGYHEGIPLIAAREAKRRGFSTLAVSPAVIKTLKETKKFENLYSMLITEGENWGDESYLFSGLADSVIILSGGFWTRLEYDYAKQLNKKIFLVKNTGGISDEIQEESENVFHVSSLQPNIIKGKIA